MDVTLSINFSKKKKKKKKKSKNVLQDYRLL